MEAFSTQQRPERTILGLGYSLLVDSKTTDGAYELMRFVAPPDAGPPPHRHTREEECFLIQEGEFEIIIEGETFPAKPGDFVHLPRGKSHSFRNVGGTVGSFLCWVMPLSLEAACYRTTRFDQIGRLHAFAGPTHSPLAAGCAPPQSGSRLP